MTKIPSSYKIIKSINVNSEDEKSVILTKIDPNYNNESFFEETVEIISEEKEKEIEIEVEQIDVEAIREEIRNQILEEIRENIQEERANMIRIAKVEAENLKAEATKQGQELGLKKGYEQGHQQGYKDGLDEANQGNVQIRNNAIDMVKQAEKNIIDYFKTNKMNMLNLAAEIAESIIHYTIDTSSENILMIVNPILEKYGKKGNITISCHPDNMGYLKEHLHQLEEEYPDSKFIIFEDGNLEKNGCIIENKTQVIDLQIKKQLNSIIDEIKEI